MINYDPFEAISIAQEEAAEVIKELSKIRRTGHSFCRNGGTKDNTRFAQEEIWDMLILLELANFSLQVPEDYREYKINKLKTWSNLIK